MKRFDRKAKAISVVLLLMHVALVSSAPLAEVGGIIHAGAECSMDTLTVSMQQGTGVQSLDGADEWPMFHHDTNHTGYSTSIAPDVNTTIWTFEASSRVQSSPAIVDNKLYVGTGYDFFCLNASAGTVIWNYTTASYISTSSPAVAEGRVYVVASELYCLNASTGEFIWVAGTYGAISSPAVVDGRVYVPGEVMNGISRLKCLNASTGELIWKSVVGNGIATAMSNSPAVADGKVYIGLSASDGWGPTFFCLNASTGDIIWNAYLTHASSSPAIFEGRVYVGGNNDLYCLNASTGTLVWAYFTNYSPTSPAIAYGRVYMGVDNGRIYCLNASNGEYIWDYTTSSYIQDSSPAIADGKVYIGCWDRYVYCFNASNGAVIWDYQANDHIDASPAVADGRVYIGSMSWPHGKLYAFGMFHDVAVTNVTTDPAKVDQGMEVTITVDAKNYGSFTENFDVTVYANATQIGRQAIDDLGPNANESLDFAWNTTSFDIGNYSISAAADLLVNETDTSNNSREDGIVTVTSPIHEIAVAEITRSKTVVGEGYSLSVNVGVENQGDNAEIFNLTTLYDYINWSSGLVGYWSFDEGSGAMAYDTSSCGNNGTLTNGPIWVDGKYGKALSFDGEDDYVNVPNAASLNPAELTFEGWFYPLPDTEYQALLSKGYASYLSQNEDYEFVWIPDGAHPAHFVVNTANNGRTSWYAFSNVSSDQWHYVAMTYKSGQWRVYYDGQMWERTDVTGDLIGSSYPLQIGAESEAGRLMKGSIDEVRIYNRALSEEEIMANMMQPHGKIASQTVTLASRDSTAITFTWNTTGIAYGNYTLNAMADTVPGETDTTDNTCLDGWIVVTIPGDINGDFRVGPADFALLSTSYGSTPGEPKWNPNADINSDGKVGPADFALLSAHYGQRYP